MSSLLQWKYSHLCNPRLCALIQVICRLADKNAALRIQYHSSSSQIKHTFLYVYKCVVDQNAYTKVSGTFINYKKKLKLRACSHEPGTVNYPGVMVALGQGLPRAHMMICCPGTTLPRVNFIAPVQVQRYLIITNLSEFL